MTMYRLGFPEARRRHLARYHTIAAFVQVLPFNVIWCCYDLSFSYPRNFDPAMTNAFYFSVKSSAIDLSAASGFKSTPAFEEMSKQIEKVTFKLSQLRCKLLSVVECTAI